jgi:hypothetical protein
MIYRSLASWPSSIFSTIAAFSRKIGPHQESDPNANATHVNPSVVRTKLLLKDKTKMKKYKFKDEF